MTPDAITLSAVDEVFSENLTAEENALHIHAENAVELLFGDVEERRGGVDAGAIDENVHAAGTLENGGEQAFDFWLAGGFSGVEPSLASGSGDSIEAGFGFVGIAANDDHFGASAGESFGHRATEFSGTADDDGDLTGETKELLEVIRRIHHCLRLVDAQPQTSGLCD